MRMTTTKPRLTAEQKIAALEAEIAERKAKAEAKAQAEAGAKKYQLEQLDIKATEVQRKVMELEKWFADHNLDIDSVTAVAPVKKETAASA